MTKEKITKKKIVKKETAKEKIAKEKKKKYYFTKEHEDAIVKYAASTDPKEKSQLYIEYIGPSISEMVDKIVYTYKFTNLPNIDFLKEECKIWLTTILDKFDPTRGHKAFSYFSVITKNWFIHEIKKTSLRNKKEVKFDDLQKDITNEKLIVNNRYCEMREQREFWMHLWEEINSWNCPENKFKQNEKKVLEAIKILFDSSESIEIFNKKAIYLYLREITGLNTKQVVNSLNKIRVRYREFKKNWDEDKIK